MKMVTLSNKIRKTLRGSSGGFTLIEVLVALVLFAIIGITFAGGLATSSRAVLTADVRTNAESLARTQMEYVKSQDYSAAPWGYVVTHLGSTCTSGDCPPWWNSAYHLSDQYARYTVDVEADALDDPDNGIQEITVTVSHEGKVVITLVGYKVDR
jgi:prepilin-type N-terminal cleavage/methylation domain-containing protein